MSVHIESILVHMRKETTKKTHTKNIDQKSTTWHKSFEKFKRMSKEDGFLQIKISYNKNKVYIVAAE